MNATIGKKLLAASVLFGGLVVMANESTAQAGGFSRFRRLSRPTIRRSSNRRPTYRRSNSRRPVYRRASGNSAYRLKRRAGNGRRYYVRKSVKGGKRVGRWIGRGARSSRIEVGRGYKTGLRQGKKEGRNASRGFKSIFGRR